MVVSSAGFPNYHDGLGNVGIMIKCIRAADGDRLYNNQGIC